jgi:LacI family transcriptional regulator
VPDDVSIIGFDNISDAALCSPSLTTVAAPLDLLGRAAVETPLAQTSRCSAVAARSAMLPADLVVRGSAGPRGARPALSTAV